MKKKILFQMAILSILIFIGFFLFGFISVKNSSPLHTDLIKSSDWYIAGPAIESQEIINKDRLEKGIITVTAKNNPSGEIELNVMVTPSNSNDGKPTNLSESSKFISITYKSSHLIKLQAREGNPEGTGCIHGGSHPRVDLPVSSKKFSTIQIPWTAFRQDGLVDGKLLNIQNLCKLNFVNYNPVSGATLEIKSVIID